MASQLLQGAAQFAKTLRDLDPSKVRGLKLRILKRAAAPMATRMGELAPWEPGKPDLKDSIQMQAIRSVDDPEFGGKMALAEDDAAVAVGPSKDAFYGYFVEYGTAPHGNHPGTPAQPFARPAFDETVDASIRLIQEDIWAHLRDTATRSGTGRGV